MANCGIGPAECALCTARNAERDAHVPCEREGGLCYVTQREPEDDELPMLSSSAISFVIDTYFEITGMSRSAEQRVVRSKGKKTEEIILYLPTLEKLDLWMNTADWKTIPIERYYFLYLIGLFHRIYTNEIVSKHA